MNAVVRRYMAIPTISFVIVTKGPALIAGSIFNFINKNGAVDPIVAAILTAKIIPNPTAVPNNGDV